MTRFDIVMEGVLKKVIAANVEYRFVLAISMCIDVDMLMSKRCPFCGIEFKRRGSLANHIKIRHYADLNNIIQCAVNQLKEWRLRKGGKNG
ncbi:MAG: hypothetical protein QW764_04660 [Desulfurococcaceae archaeon]